MTKIIILPIALLLLAARVSVADTSTNNPVAAATSTTNTAATSFTVLPAEKLLPDDTLVMVTVPDCNRAREIYRNSPQGQLWNDPAMKDFKDKFFGKVSGGYIASLERALGVRFDDYTNLPQGQFTLAFVQNTWQGKEGKGSLLLLLDTKDKSSQLTANLESLKKKWVNFGKTIRTEKIRDVDFSIVDVSKVDFSKPDSKPAEPMGPGLPPPMPVEKDTSKKEIYIGQAGSLLIVGDSAKVIEKVLARMSGGQVNVLSDLSAFDADRAMFHDTPVFGWINTKVLAETFSRSSETTDADAAANPFAFQIDKVIASLGLTALKAVAFNCKFSNDGSEFNLALSVPEAARTGILKILAGEAKDCNPPPFVPADAVKFQRWRFDGQKTWATLRKTVGDISPAALGFIDLTLDTIDKDGKEKDPSFDLNKNLFGNIGGDLVTYEKVPKAGSTDPNSAPSILLLGSPNPDQLADALKRVGTMTPAFSGAVTDHEFLGHKIHSIPLPAGPQTNSEPPPTRLFNYTTAGGYVAFSGDSGMIEEYLRSSESPPKALRDLPGLSDAMQKVAGNDASLFGFSNEAATMRASFEAMRNNPDAPDPWLAFGTVMPLLGMGEIKSKDWVDVSLLPPFDRISKYFYFTVYGASTTPDSIKFKVFAPTPPELRK
jgi:hypothetical protein